MMTIFSFLALMIMVAMTQTEVLVTGRPATLLSEYSLTTSTPFIWPSNVMACYSELLSSHKLTECQNTTQKKYNLTDTDPQNCSTSTNNSNNCFAVCYAFYDQMECYDHMACDYCSTNESMAFHEAVPDMVRQTKNESKCRHIDDHNVNRTRCSADGSQPLSPSSDSELTTFLVIIICCMLAAVLFAVCCMFIKMYLTGNLFEENSTKRKSNLQKKSTRKEYGPADFMDPKKRSRFKSQKSSQRARISQMKFMKTSQMQKNTRTPKKGLLSLKTTLKTFKTSKTKQKSSKVGKLSSLAAYVKVKSCKSKFKASSTGGTCKKQKRPTKSTMSKTSKTSSMVKRSSTAKNGKHRA